jgi:hypothetical protein
LEVQSSIPVTKYRNYSEDDIRTAVLSSKSIAEVLRKLELAPVGGNYGTVKKKITELGVDISHFTGRAWMPKGWHFKSLDELTMPRSIKRRLIQERGHQCECCSLRFWMEQPIVLELDHINGNRNENSRENLRLLCPNCHAQTPTWRRCKSALADFNKNA